MNTSCRAHTGQAGTLVSRMELGGSRHLTPLSNCRFPLVSSLGAPTAPAYLWKSHP